MSRSNIRSIKSGPLGGYASLGGVAREAGAQPVASFEQLRASSLYCGRCKQAMPVREKVLLHLPSGDLVDYLCARCGSSVGTKKGR